MLQQLGQDLFAPPNVKGWDGGVTWITTNTLLTRYNDAQSLVEGLVATVERRRFFQESRGRRRWEGHETLKRLKMGGVPLEKILSPEQRRTSAPSSLHWKCGCFKVRLIREQEQTLREFLDNKTKLTDADIRHHYPVDDVHAGIASHLNRYEKRNHAPDPPRISPAHGAWQFACVDACRRF
jgi:hypothetical protein